MHFRVNVEGLAGDCKIPVLKIREAVLHAPAYVPAAYCTLALKTRTDGEAPEPLVAIAARRDCDRDCNFLLCLWIKINLGGRWMRS